jgi:hypothetical protein
MFDAVCIAITPPINADINATIGIDFTPINSISENKRFQKTFHISGFEKTTKSMEKYLPILLSTFIERLN